MIRSSRAATALREPYGPGSIQNYIISKTNDVSDVLEVALLAREAGLSRTGFAERFTQRLGVTPMSYVTSWRMQIAREALVTRGLSVAEAAEVSGYASESAFSRVFKKEIGLSPAAFRQTGEARQTAA